MNVLLIDNGTTLLEKLEALIPGDEVVHTSRDFTPADVERADVIILSGSSAMQLVGNEQEYAQELDMVRTVTKPVIGICFGSELITVAFGGTLKELTNRHVGIREITLVDPSLVPGTRAIRAFENHRWIIDSVPSGFTVEATSDDGPEMIRHTKLPIYGLQFHPENFVDETAGDELFLRLLRQVSMLSFTHD